MKIGVVKETYPGEQRVALIPAVIPSLIKGGMEVVIESQAGDQSGYPDTAYIEKGGTIADSRDQVFEVSDFILQVRLLGANPQEGQADLKRFRNGQNLVGIAEALGNPQSVQELAAQSVTAFALRSSCLGSRGRRAWIFCLLWERWPGIKPC